MARADSVTVSIAAEISGILIRILLVSCVVITLRGEVLPIGGLKEKLLAAHRGSIKTVIIPHENEKDLVEISDVVKADLNIVPVKWIDQVLEVALTKMPKGSTEPNESGEIVTKNKKILTDKPAARH